MLGKLPKIPGIYSIFCIANGKFYIGSSKNMRQRQYEHLWDLRSGRHHSLRMQRAFNKYGTDLFVFEVLEDSISDLRKSEQIWLDITRCYDPKVGFNVSTDAYYSGVIPTAEQRKRLSDISKEKLASLSPEAKQRMTDGGIKGRARALEVCRGRKHTEGWRKAHSECIKNKWANMSPETRTVFIEKCRLGSIQAKRGNAVIRNDGMIFDNQAKAAKYHGVGTTTMSRWCKDERAHTSDLGQFSFKYLKVEV